MVAPGDYEGVKNLDDTIPRYVVFVPDSYHDIAPAPLFVFLTTVPLQSIDDTDAVRPSLGGLDGIIAVGSADASGDIIEEVSHAFCIDPDRILTTLLPPTTAPSRAIEPDPSVDTA
jgi:hypothetical protein